MAYLHVGDKTPKCEWHNCKDDASSHVTNSTGSDAALLCKFHKRVAVINLEQYDRIHAPESARRALENRRPGKEAPAPLPKQIPKARPGQEVMVDEWEKKAAEKADSAAVQIDKTEVDPGEDQKSSAASEIVPPLISEIPKPRPLP